MLRILCRLMLVHHKWMWLTDFCDDAGHYTGLYQCTRCQEISIGAIRQQH
jgi:hypothetical protein